MFNREYIETNAIKTIPIRDRIIISPTDHDQKQQNFPLKKYNESCKHKFNNNMREYTRMLSGESSLPHPIHLCNTCRKAYATKCRYKVQQKKQLRESKQQIRLAWLVLNSYLSFERNIT